MPESLASFSTKKKKVDCLVMDCKPEQGWLPPPPKKKYFTTAMITIIANSTLLSIKKKKHPHDKYWNRCYRQQVRKKGVLFFHFWSIRFSFSGTAVVWGVSKQRERERERERDSIRNRVDRVFYFFC